MIVEWIALGIGSAGLAIGGASLLFRPRIGPPGPPGAAGQTRDFYGLMGDLWESPIGKPGFAPPPGWINSLRSFSEDGVIEHLIGVGSYRHGFVPRGVDPVEEVKGLLNQHDTEHHLLLADHQHYEG